MNTESVVLLIGRLKDSQREIDRLNMENIRLRDMLKDLHVHVNLLYDECCENDPYNNLL
jgi:hypothetical protein